MTRSLLVTCTGPKCRAEGRVQLYDLEARELPAGWLLVNSSYDDNPMEFCSLACVVSWGVAMQKARASQREWQLKPLPRKAIDAPEGALL